MPTFDQVSEICKVVGLVVGGLWVAWTFQKLQKARAAELDNNRKLTEIQKSRIEQEEFRTRLFRQQPQLAIQIIVTETVSPTKACKSFLCVSVILKNEGEQNLLITFDNSTLTVGHSVLGKDGKPMIGVVQRFAPSLFDRNTDVPQMLSERIFRIGQQRQMVLAILPICEPGGYIIQFRALYCKIRFDDEKPSRKKLKRIDAIEQTFYFATGKPDEVKIKSDIQDKITEPNAAADPPSGSSEKR